ncbi:hypothetical protein VNO80_03264 [Phaseolus coccineus]|uniref:Uncharacterized protein n=1 Tax=Phaseolus coccineus TaxID=3886 RepID=A0AAN9NRP5_PHACN
MLDQIFVNKSSSKNEVEDILKWGTEELFNDSLGLNGKDMNENNYISKNEPVVDVDHKHRKRTNDLGDVYKDKTDSNIKILWDEIAILKLLYCFNLQDGSTDNAEGDSENDMLGSVKVPLPCKSFFVVCVLICSAPIVTVTTLFVPSVVVATVRAARAIPKSSLLPRTKGRPVIPSKLPPRRPRSNETSVWIVELREVHATTRGGHHRGKVISSKVIPNVQPSMLVREICKFTKVDADTRLIWPEPMHNF